MIDGLAVIQGHKERSFAGRRCFTLSISPTVTCLDRSKKTRLLTDLHQIITRLDVMLVWLGVAPCRVCRVLSDRPLVPLGVPSRSRRRRVSGPRTGPASFDAATCTAPSPRSETYGWSAPHDCWSVLAG